MFYSKLVKNAAQFFVLSALFFSNFFSHYSHIQALSPIFFFNRFPNFFQKTLPPLFHNFFFEASAHFTIFFLKLLLTSQTPSNNSNSDLQSGLQHSPASSPAFTSASPSDRAHSTVTSRIARQLSSCLHTFSSQSFYLAACSYFSYCGHLYLLHFATCHLTC